MTDYRQLSLWLDTAPASLKPRTCLPGNTSVDVAIVGAGYTGLWTAYYLLRSDPGLRVAVLESQIAGFGASGRNGGWCSALFPVGLSTLAAEAGREAAVAQYRATRDAVPEIAGVCAAEGIDAELAMGGTIVLARCQAHLTRADEQVALAREYGQQLTRLDGQAARDRLHATPVLGATYTPHCAAINPAKLVRGLADVVESRGARIYERTRATRIDTGVVHTDHGTVRADVVVRATEGYTATLPGLRRVIAPVYSLVIATEPLSAAVWDEIGLRERETFSDFRHLIIYGQRTVDDRMVFGGRGAPYHFGSRIRESYDRVPRVFAALQRALTELFPVLRNAEITHRWGGPLGIARDWHASVGMDRATGLAWAGGYIGDGVSTSNLAGRTLADLIMQRETDLTALPWVGHRARAWEPEPLRWLGADAGLRAMGWADDAEARGGNPSRMAGLVNAMMGR